MRLFSFFDVVGGDDHRFPMVDTLTHEMIPYATNEDKQRHMILGEIILLQIANQTRRISKEMVN